jgi:hypothetical protein
MEKKQKEICNILMDKIITQYKTIFEEYFPKGVPRLELISLIFSAHLSSLEEILKTITPKDLEFQSQMDIFLNILYKAISNLPFIEGIKINYNDESNKVH